MSIINAADEYIIESSSVFSLKLFASSKTMTSEANSYPNPITAKIAENNAAR